MKFVAETTAGDRKKEEGKVQGFYLFILLYQVFWTKFLIFDSSVANQRNWVAAVARVIYNNYYYNNNNWWWLLLLLVVVVVVVVVATVVVVVVVDF